MRLLIFYFCIFHSYVSSYLQKEVMATPEENGSLFPIFILTMMALSVVPYTIVRLSRSVTRKARTIHCQCSVCSRSGKYKRSILKRVNLLFQIVPRNLFLENNTICDNSSASTVVLLPRKFLHAFSFYLQISNFSTCSNLTILLLWVIMVILIYYIKHTSREVYNISFSLLGLTIYSFFSFFVLPVFFLTYRRQKILYIKSLF